MTEAAPEKYNDGYDCFRQLIQGLRDEGFEKAAGRLDYLLNRVAWTTGSELLGELGLAIRDFERTRSAHYIITSCDTQRMQERGSQRVVSP